MTERFIPPASHGIGKQNYPQNAFRFHISSLIVSLLVTNFIPAAKLDQLIIEHPTHDDLHFYSVVNRRPRFPRYLLHFPHKRKTR